MKRLLTIGIPTYNRGLQLQIMLSCLNKKIASLEKYIEIIISDNCSNDGTSDVISEWTRIQSPDLRVKHVRHPRNIGVSANLVSLLYAATSDYFIFLGDDDGFHSDNLYRLINLLRIKRPVAVIQAHWTGKNRISKIGRVEFDDALFLFYEYGNAWAGVIDREAAITAINKRSLRSEIESIVWPQTVFGYLAMFDLSPTRSIETVEYEIGRPLTESLNLTNKTYWIRSFTDLLRAAAIIQRSTGNQSIRRYFINHKSQGLILHIKAIFFNALIEDDRASLITVRNVSAENFGFRGFILSLLLSLDNHPKILRMIASTFYNLANARNGKSFSSMITDARNRRNDEVLNRANSGKRLGDWF